MKITNAAAVTALLASLALTGGCSTSQTTAGAERGLRPAGAPTNRPTANGVASLRSNDTNARQFTQSQFNQNQFDQTQFSQSQFNQNQLAQANGGFNASEYTRPGFNDANFNGNTPSTFNTTPYANTGFNTASTGVNTPANASAQNQRGWSSSNGYAQNDPRQFNTTFNQPHNGNQLPPRGNNANGNFNNSNFNSNSNTTTFNSPARQGSTSVQDLNSGIIDVTALPGAERLDESDGGVLGLGNVTQVSFTSEGSDFDPTVTADGTRVVFASTAHRTSSDLYIKNVNGKVVTQLTNDPGDDAMPAVSPDSSRIVFASNRAGAWNLYLMPISGGKAIQLTNGTTPDIAPSWAPDGRRVVFSRLGEVSGRWEMWVMDVTNPATASFIGYGVLPQWSPVTRDDGADTIAFQLSRERGGRTFAIWTVDLRDGKVENPTEIAASTTAALINPSWSPDGQALAYAEVPGNDDWTSARRLPSTAALWLQSLDGQQRVKLTGGPALALMPRWAGEDRLFFVSNRAGRENIWTVQVGEQTLALLRNQTGPTHAQHTTDNAHTTGEHADAHATDEHAEPVTPPVAGASEHPGDH